MRRFMYGVIAGLLLLACDDRSAFHEYREVPRKWHRDSAVVFTIPQMDSTVAHNMFITLRNDNSYPFSNLFLITEMTFPNGRELTDTLEYRMAAPDGTWLGGGFSEVKENKLWYREDVRFRESGNYTLKIRQAMRRNGEEQGVETLKGITEVGVRVERTNTD